MRLLNCCLNQSDSSYITFHLHAGDDLRVVMTETVSISDWITLGVALGLHVPHVNEIEEDYTSVRKRQKHVLQKWLDTGNASWAALVDTLKSPLVDMEGLANQIELKYISE